MAFRVGNVTGTKRAKISQRPGIRRGWTPAAKGRSDSVPTAIDLPVPAALRGSVSQKLKSTTPSSIPYGGYVAASDDEPDGELDEDFEYVDPFGPPSPQGDSSEGTAERSTNQVSSCILIHTSQFTISNRVWLPSSLREPPDLSLATSPLRKTSKCLRQPLRLVPWWQPETPRTGRCPTFPFLPRRIPSGESNSCHI